MQTGIAILHIVTGDPLLIQLKARCVTLSLKSSSLHQLAVYAVWDGASSLPEVWHSLTIGVCEDFMLDVYWSLRPSLPNIHPFFDESEIKFSFIGFKHELSVVLSTVQIQLREKNVHCVKL